MAPRIVSRTVSMNVRTGASAGTPPLGWSGGAMPSWLAAYSAGTPGTGRSGRANTLRKAAGGSGAGDASAARTASSISAVTSDSNSASWASVRSRCSMRYCLSRWNGSFFRHASTSWGVR